MQDERAERQRTSVGARPTWRVPLAVALAAALGLGVLKLSQGPGMPGPASASAAPITQLQSRLTSPRRVEVWGTTSAPDGTSVEIQARLATGLTVARMEAPAHGGHFYAAARLSRSASGEGMSVTATLAP